MKQKVISIVILMLMLAGCAKLIESGSSVTPITSPTLNAPTIAPTIEPTAPVIDSPLPTPFQSPLALPEFTSPAATPGSM